MKPKSVSLHIDELVLHGFPPGDRRRVGAAVRRELARLLAERAPEASAEKRTLDAGSFALGADLRPEGAGRQIAGAVHKGLPR